MHSVTTLVSHARLQSMKTADLTSHIADCEVELAQIGGNNLNNWRELALAQNEQLERLRKCVTAYGACNSKEISGNPTQGL